MSWKGIANAKRVKSRPKSKRGGQVAADDGLDYSDSAGMPMLRRSFLEYMGVVNFAPRTIEARGKDLQGFFQWCQERELFRADAITKPILEAYQRQLYRHRKANGKPLGFTTQQSRLISIRAYFKWLTRQNYIPSNPASELELPRTERRLPMSPLTIREVEMILIQPNLSDPIGVRDRALLEALYSTGIRRMEVANLQLEDVLIEKGAIMVRQGKGRKDRLTPIGGRALQWIERYCEEVRPLLAVDHRERTLFLSVYGEALSPDYLTRLVGQYVRKADIGRTGSCHLFRHACATLMLENGADMRFVQSMLGHDCIASTQVYTELSIRQLKKVHALTHPAAGETFGDLNA
jgi:integrase/recombinase XerD